MLQAVQIVTSQALWKLTFLHRFYDKKYEVFLKLVEHQREYRAIMNSF